MTPRNSGKWGFVLFFVLVSLSVISTSSALTLNYVENELVRLIPEATDFDEDSISFTYAPPLNSTGEWQTDYDDAGTYETIVKAFDGKDITEEVVTIVINNVNRAPEINVVDFEFVEGDLVDVHLEVSDPDNDDLELTYSEPLDENGRWQTDFQSAGVYAATITASDGVDIVEESFMITILDKNRGPRILSTLPDTNIQNIKETQEISFFVDAIDVDGDVLSYIWYLDGNESGEGEEFIFATDYESAGEHEILLEVSDGSEILNNRWTIFVENVNRAPALDAIEDVSINEGDTFQIELPSVDIDGDLLSYTFDGPLTDGMWTPTFEDSGVYEINVKVTDGQLSDETSFTIFVEDVDREPEFADIEDVRIAENEELNLAVSVADPDGDEVELSLSRLEGASIDNYEIIWAVDYDFISLPNHFFARLLSRLRVDRFVYKHERLLTPVITACGKDKCANKTFKLLVQNVNRPPILQPVEDFSVNEGEEVIIRPVATDPDNEYVRFRYSDPLWWTGRWTTDYEDAGQYAVTIRAADSEVSVENNFTISVENVNRMPKFGRLTDKTVRENNTISFKVPVADDDGDNLTLLVEDLPVGAQFSEGVFTWKPDHETVNFADGKKEFLISFAVTDADTFIADLNQTEDEFGGQITVKKSIVITVLDVNRPPVINVTEPNSTSIALVGQPVVFNVEASDPDGNELTYRWKFGVLDRLAGHKAVRRTFSSVGEKEVQVIVSDGKSDEAFTWNVRVGRLRQRITEQS